MFICIYCDSEKDENEMACLEWEVCSECLAERPNVSGYCGIDCRMSGKCDETC